MVRCEAVKAGVNVPVELLIATREVGLDCMVQFDSMRLLL